VNNPAALLFNSAEFFVFFTVVFAAYWAMPWHRARMWFLLAASYYFYASWNPRLAGVVCASSIIDWLIGLALERLAGHRTRKSLVVGSVCMNLGLLFYFKYANFFLANAGDALHRAGFATILPVLQVVLPIGISFYTFEAISYTVDVFLRRAPAERNLANFLLFISFFPRMIAGPIIRARRFLPQVHRRKRWDVARVELGVRRHAELDLLLRYSNNPPEVSRVWWLSRIVPAAECKLTGWNWLSGRMFVPNAAQRVGNRDAFGWVQHGFQPVAAELREKYNRKMLDEYRPIWARFHLSRHGDGSLRELLDRCRSAGCEPFLIHMPESTHFAGSYPPGARRDIDDYLGKLQAQYRFRMIDARAWVPDDEFSDGLHLLAAGASRFTEKLAEEMPELAATGLPSPNGTGARVHD
jgi:hypothetical protein